MRLHSLRLYDPSDVSLVWYAKLVALHIVYRCLKLSVTWYMFSPQNVTIHWQLQLTFGIVLHFDYEWIGFSYSIIRRLRNPISWSCRPDQWCKKMIPVSQANYFCSLSLFLPNPISVFLLHLPMFLFFFIYIYVIVPPNRRPARCFMLSIMRRRVTHLHIIMCDFLKWTA